MAVAPPRPELDLATLERVQRRVLWLATAIVHHANRVRPALSRDKIVRPDLPPTASASPAP